MVGDAGSKERIVAAAALLFIPCLFCAIYTENGIAIRIATIKPNRNIFLYDEKIDIISLQSIV